MTQKDIKLLLTPMFFSWIVLDGTLLCPALNVVLWPCLCFSLQPKDDVETSAGPPVRTIVILLFGNQNDLLLFICIHYVGSARPAVALKT